MYDLAAGKYAPGDVADQLDRTLGEVHATLAYYDEHPDEMRALRRDREEMTQTLAEHALSV